MKKTKKIIALGLIAVMAVSVFTGCSKKTSSESDFDKAKEIGVITREDGSAVHHPPALSFCHLNSSTVNPDLLRSGIQR